MGIVMDIGIYTMWECPKNDSTTSSGEQSEMTVTRESGELRGGYLFLVPIML